MAKLHISKFGQGPDLILLHGWGSSSKVWQTCIQELSENFRVWCVDLPGHGKSHSVTWDGSTQQGVEMLSQCLPSTSSIVGWSLGGLLAQLFVQQYPQRVKNLILVASLPKFIASKNWVHGMPKEIFESFYQQFSKSPRDTLQKFCALQSLNSSSSKQVQSVLINSLSDQPVHLTNIEWGLQWLQEIDLRDELELSSFPMLLLHGDSDAVCSFSAAQDAIRIWENASLKCIPYAGHAPFISHPSVFVNLIKDLNFLNA